MSEAPLAAIAAAVEREGGDADDVLDLVAVWERLHADWSPRVDAMLREAAGWSCRCETRCEATSDGRCVLCFGFVRERGR
jgi:hypothetical protein